MKTEIANKLVLLNGFRKELGQIDLITWSKSEAALDAEIVKAQDQFNARNDSRKAVKDHAELAELLTRLNGYYAMMGVKEVKAWHGTADELRAAIRKAKADHKEMIDAEKTMARSKAKITLAPVVATLKGGNLAKQKPGALKAKVEKAKAKKEAKATIAAAPVAEQGLLPRIAAELGMNPKVARAKLRKKFGSDWRNLTEKEVRAALA